MSRHSPPAQLILLLPTVASVSTPHSFGSNWLTLGNTVQAAVGIGIVTWLVCTISSYKWICESPFHICYEIVHSYFPMFLETAVLETALNMRVHWVVYTCWLALHLETQSQTFPYYMCTFAQVVRPQLSLFYLAVLSQVDGVVAERHALCVLRSSWSWLYSWRMRGPAVHGAWWRMLLWQISSSWLGCHSAGEADASMEFENDFDLQRHDNTAYAIAASRNPGDDGSMYLLLSFKSIANSVLCFW